VIGTSVSGGGHKGRKTFLSVRSPECLVPAGENIASLDRRSIANPVSNCQRLQIGAIPEEDAGILRAERMESLWRDRKAKDLEPRGRYRKVPNGQNEMIDAMPVSHKSCLFDAPGADAGY